MPPPPPPDPAPGAGATLRFRRIHVTGASGSGTTTLGRAIAARWRHAHLDTDAFFWEATDPPFTTKRAIDERLRLLGAALETHASWVLSGALDGWGASLQHRFDLVVFLWIPPELRMARLAARERERHGLEAISPGGPLHGAHREFLAWAERYDSAGPEQRSLVRHRAWLETLRCPVLRLEGDLTVEERLAAIARASARGEDER